MTAITMLQDARGKAVIPPVTAANHVCHLVSRWARGGMELQLAGQLPHADPRAAAHTILSLDAPDAEMPAAPEGVQIVDLSADDAPRPLGARGGTAHAIARELLRREADILHVRGLWLLRDACRAARIAGDLPLVFGFHGLDDQTRRAPWWRAFDWRRLLRRCDAIVTVCESLRRELTARFEIAESAITVIRNGVDCERFRPVSDVETARRKLGLDSARFNLVCLGSISHVKGQDVLMRALARLGEAGRALRVVLVGRNCSGGAVQRAAAETSIAADIRFAGEVTDPRDYLHAADALVCPSRFEGCSNAILEGMACGLPIVATAAGGTPELVAHGVNGRLVRPDAPDELAAAIAHVLDHRGSLPAMARASRERALSGFTLSAATRAYEGLYARLADARFAQWD